MILVDTGPLVALFDPKDKAHSRCRRILHGIRDPLYTTIPVLTEAFYMLTPASIGSDGLRDFVLKRGMHIWFFTEAEMTRAFELMEQYADHPMDLADASLVVAGETLGTKRIFTIDRRDFDGYRLKRGHRHVRFELLE